MGETTKSTSLLGKSIQIQGWRLKLARKTFEYTQATLAERLSVSDRVLRTWEAADAPIKRLDQLVDIFNLLPVFWTFQTGDEDLDFNLFNWAVTTRRHNPSADLTGIVDKLLDAVIQRSYLEPSKTVNKERV